MSVPKTPTFAEAQEAAQLLIDEGVSRVLLFGSLARDAADENSDIDLVALYNDLGDYSTRRLRATELRVLCQKALGREVDILVTDWPEWKRRVVDVTASFESSIANGTIVLADTPRSANIIDWDKDMRMPSSNVAEALNHLRDLTLVLRKLYKQLLAEEHDDSTEDESWEFLDDVSKSSEAALAIEQGLKILIRMAGATPDNSHRIDHLLKQLDEHDP